MQSIETWSVPFDFRLRRMRLEGASWDAISQDLSVSPEAASARAQEIGARWVKSGRKLQHDLAREALPAGDAGAWDVLTEGTWLAGTRYPLLPSCGKLS